jgi:hypothetical protein
LDLTDLFAFTKPGDAGKSILIMDVHPSTSLNPPVPTPSEPFAPEARYEIRVDTNGDLLADVTFRMRFAPGGDGGMTATVLRVEGPDADGPGESGEIIVAGAAASMGSQAVVTQSGDYRFFAGWRSDPFFFDAIGAVEYVRSMREDAFTGEDTFADRDVCSIALELPNSALGSEAGVNLWQRTLVQADDDGGGWVQADRGVRASQTPFLAGADRNAYLSAEPARDGRFVAMFAHALEHTGGYSPDAALAAARTLLPDVLPYDPTRPAAYPTNGRALTDDTSDLFLPVLTNGKITGDNVGPHTDFLAEFPYVGAPHNARTGIGRAAAR